MLFSSFILHSERPSFHFRRAVIAMAKRLFRFCLTLRNYCLTIKIYCLTLAAQSLTFSLSQMTKEKFTLPLAWRENEGYNPTINARFFMKQFSLSKKNYLFSSARYLFSKNIFPFLIILFYPNILGSRKSVRYFCSNLII